MLISKSQHQRKSKFRLLPSNTWPQGKDQIKAVTATAFDKSGISGQGAMKVTLIWRLACKGVFSGSTPVELTSKNKQRKKVGYNAFTKRLQPTHWH